MNAENENEVFGRANVNNDRTYTVPALLSRAAKIKILIRERATANLIVKAFIGAVQLPTAATATINNITIVVASIIAKANKLPSELAILNTPVNPDVVTSLATNPADTQVQSYAAAAGINTATIATAITTALATNNTSTVASAIQTQTQTATTTVAGVTTNPVPFINSIYLDGTATKKIYDATAGASTQTAASPWSPITVAFSEAVDLTNVKFKIRVTETIGSTVTTKTVVHGYTRATGELSWSEAFGSAPAFVTTNQTSFTITPGSGIVKPGFVNGQYVAATIRIDLLQFEGATKNGVATVLVAPPVGTYGIYNIPAHNVQ